QARETRPARSAFGTNAAVSAANVTRATRDDEGAHRTAFAACHARRRTGKLRRASAKTIRAVARRFGSTMAGLEPPSPLRDHPTSASNLSIIELAWARYPPPKRLK